MFIYILKYEGLDRLIVSVLKLNDATLSQQFTIFETPNGERLMSFSIHGHQMLLSDRHLLGLEDLHPPTEFQI